MISLETMAGIGAVFILILLGVLFLVPTEQKKRKRREKKPAEPAPSKDWEAVSSKMGRHIQALRKEAEEYQKNEKLFQKQIAAEQVRVKKLEEKISQERQWHGKEEKELDKTHAEMIKLTKEIQSAQESFSKEHAAYIRLERDFKELKMELEEVNEKRRKFEAEAINLREKNNALRQELQESRRENAELNKKKEEATFVGKSQYDKLEKDYKELQKRFERLERESKKRNE